LPAVPGDSLTNPPPQFSTAEYAPGGDACRSCRQPIAGNYYRVNGVMVCPACADKVKSRIPKDTHEAYVRGLLMGAGGAVLGLIGYALFSIATGWIVGYVSLGVGYLVGKAITLGSRGVGGRRYQIAAALFTYAAVSLAAIPIGISQAAKQRQTNPAPSPPAVSSSSGGGAEPQPPAVDREPRSRSASGSGVAAALGALVLVGLASPFLELQNPLHGLIGLFILAIGVRIAWRITAGSAVKILGPFARRASAAGQAG